MVEATKTPISLLAPGNETHQKYSENGLLQMTVREQCAGVTKQTCSVMGETVIPCYIKQA